jgi:hypothetical protein
MELDKVLLENGIALPDLEKHSKLYSVFEGAHEGLAGFVGYWAEGYAAVFLVLGSDKWLWLIGVEKCEMLTPDVAQEIFTKYTPLNSEAVVVVDEARLPFRGALWCHLWSADEVTLHRMALRLELQPSWFQGNNLRFRHYDLSPTKRKKAIALGAKEVTAYELVQMVRVNDATRYELNMRKWGLPLDGYERMHTYPVEEMA